MTWNPRSFLRPDQRVFSLSATEIEKASDPQECQFRVTLKSRPGDHPYRANWRRRADPFLLDSFTQAVMRIHSLEKLGGDRWQSIDKVAQSAFGDLHRGLAKYFAHSLNAYFDYHEAREEELGSLKFLSLRPEIEIQPGRAILSTWGFLYESETGDREIRRLRRSEPRTTLTAWALTSARVVADFSPRMSDQGRIWVTEVGLASGREKHLLDGVLPHEARQLYQAEVRSVANRATSALSTKTGRSCGSCDIAGQCGQVHSSTGILQINSRGPWTKTVSASDLSMYEECPSRWFMQKVAFLPRTVDITDAQLRGISVHSALAHAHKRNVACSTTDFDNEKSILAAFGIQQSSDEFKSSEPYLRSHLATCQFTDPSVLGSGIEETRYGYDADADVVTATKADAFFMRGEEMIIREVKTTHERPVTEDADGWFNRYLSNAWDLVELAQGTFSGDGRHGAVELEVLSPAGSSLFTYRTDDLPLLRMARGRLRRIAEEWIEDRIWEPRPGSHCKSCPVAAWCDARSAE
ncbi:PD-(D/E)XK nuclease family protein [Actinoplanes sp. RD1]|uniref:PD-(D/E)XK nuclease family protein n=1 Tax=Actinoplanes sp. RD1 TaxID=3064538 RepID=UPI002740FC1D|nr:PD-(D/E)XK nuclease family protein [Actinoplanes sp. RD1]